MTGRREVADFAALIQELDERVERLEAALATSAAEQNGPPKSPWLIRKEAWEYLHLSERHFDRLHMQGRIQGNYGTGDRPLFHVDDLDAMVRSLSSPPLKLARSATERRARTDAP